MKKWGCLGPGGVIPSGRHHPFLTTVAPPSSRKQLPEHLPSPWAAPLHSSLPRLGQPLLKGLPRHYDANRVVNFSEMQKESPNLF